MPGKTKQASGRPTRSRKTRNIQKANNHPSLKFCELETALSIPEVDSSESVPEVENPCSGMVEVDWWPVKRLSLWEELLREK